MPKQNEDCDIQRVARELIARYGEEAELIAAGHADTMLDQDNIAAFEIWRKVMTTVRAFHAKNQQAR